MTEYRPDRPPLVPPGDADLHIRDMTATFSADITLDSAQQKLREIEQWLPIDGDPTQTLGRLISNNSTGPLRLGYGAWRDLLLGCQFLNGQNELITAGGRTVKNVAGYDLTKFMVGHGGIFGRLVTITTRTYRRPTGAILARFEPDARQINHLLPAPCRPQWAVLANDAMWCGYLGDERTLAYYRTALPEHRPVEIIERSVEEDLKHRIELWRPAGVEGSYRAAVPPVKILEFVSAAQLKNWTADAAFGIVVGIAEKSKWDAIRAAAHRVQGSIYFMDEGQSRPDLDPQRRALLERLKIAFDPSGKLPALP
jgi:hypothetical protein